MMDMGAMPGGIVYIFIGAILLTLGRKLFWLFVGCIGFAAGFHYTPYLWNLQNHQILVIIAIFTGIIGAVLAVFFQKVAVGLAGFAAGSYIAVNLLSLLGFQIGPILWLPYLIGGIIGALLLFLIFDWALIFVSCFAGASMIIQFVKLPPGMKLGLYVVLIIIGATIQIALFKQSPLMRAKRR